MVSMRDFEIVEAPYEPLGAPRFRGSKREISFRGILAPALSPLGRGEGVVFSKPL
jgi:hypothetical protein